MKFSKSIVLITIISLITSQVAFAKRFGGGRNRGMQRHIAPQTATYNPQTTHAQPQAQPAAAPQQQKSGMGAGTAGLLGAAAGAAGGYMLGKSMAENNNASGVTKAEATKPAQNNLESNMPWGTIGILGLLLLIGLVLFKRKSHPEFNNNNNNFNQAGNGFNLPKFGINKNNGIMGTSGSATPQRTVTPTIEKMPDGIESIYFIRQAKGMFLHIQSMNNPENIAEVAKYMTNELYVETKESISQNNYIADFQNLDAQLLACDVSNNQLIASVKFSGLVSEEPEQPPVPFSETWNFVKTNISSGKWLVSGIQQDS